MLIGIDGSRAFIEGKTGTENYSYQLIKHLSQVDTENRYLIYLRPSNARGPVSTHPQSMSSLRCGHSLGDPQSRHPPHKHTKDCNWPENFKFQILNFKFLWTQIGLAKATFEDKLDVLFVPSHTLPILRKPGLKTVITVHDLGAEYLPGMHQLKQVLYLKLMTNYQLKTATKIIAVSQATKGDLMKRIGIPSEKIKVVYEGVDKTVFKKIHKDIVNDIVKKHDLDRGKYFLFVGTIQPRKNLERLIKAFQIFLKEINDERLKIKDSSKAINSSIINHQSSIKLILVGQKGWKSDLIYNLPKELGIEDKIKFLGRVSDQDLAGLYNGAMALTYPSLFEGFGLPILEAFACGCPVITSNVSSMPEVAGEAAILVDPEKEDQIAKAMAEIIKNDKLRNSLIQSGIDRVRSFDWEKCAIETLTVLKSV